MHEMSIIANIQKIVEKHAEMNNVNKVISITVGAGELSGIVEQFAQHCFGFVSEGTITEGATLRIEIDPIVMSCEGCGTNFKLQDRKLDGITCPRCAAMENLKLVSGKEIYVKNMEVI